jgi:alkane 1-monooxygenase
VARPAAPLWPLALIVPLLPVRAALLAETDVPFVAWFLTPILVFVVFPILDTLAGLDRRNPPESETARLEARRYYRWLTYAYIPLQYASLVVACALWASGELRWWESLGLATSVGLVAGIAINTAHELGHKRPALERWLSKVAMIVLAAIPPLWRRVMDRRVLDFYGGDVTRANLHPRSRRRLLERYGAGVAA